VFRGKDCSAEDMLAAVGREQLAAVGREQLAAVEGTSEAGGYSDTQPAVVDS